MEGNNNNVVFVNQNGAKNEFGDMPSYTDISKWFQEVSNQVGDYLFVDPKNRQQVEKQSEDNSEQQFFTKLIQQLTQPNEYVGVPVTNQNQEKQSRSRQDPVVRFKDTLSNLHNKFNSDQASYQEPSFPQMNFGKVNAPTEPQNYFASQMRLPKSDQFTEDSFGNMQYNDTEKMKKQKVKTPNTCERSFEATSRKFYSRPESTCEPKQKSVKCDNESLLNEVVVTTVEGTTGTSTSMADTRPENGAGHFKFGKLTFVIKYGTQVKLGDVVYKLGSAGHETLHHDGKVKIPTNTKYVNNLNPTGFSSATVQEEEIFLHNNTVVILPKGTLISDGDNLMRLQQNTNAILV